MLSRIRYVLRETGANLFRNLTLTAASLITVFVSLFLIGVVLLIQNAVENSTARWRGGVEFIVFMQPDASKDEIDAVRQALEANPQVVADKLREASLQQALQSLPWRERRVLELRYGLSPAGPMTLEDIGAQVGVTRERVRQIESRTLTKLKLSKDADRLRGDHD